MKNHIDIEFNSFIFSCVLKYAATFEGVKSYVTSNVKTDNYEKDKEKRYSVELKIPHGTTEITFKDQKIKLEYEGTGEPVGLSYEVAVFEKLRISGDNMDVLKQFIVDAKLHCEPKQSKHVHVRMYKNGSWVQLSKLPLRDIETIYLDKKFKDDTVNDVQNFLNSEEIYASYGIPYKRIFLLEGVPGSGKTSFIFAIASMFNMDIGIINFNPDIDDSVFMNAITHLPDNHILLMEDIDALFVERQSVNKSAVTFTGILNALDGVARKNKLLCFITTNYLKNLDSALIRPGRVDKVLKFDYCTREQLLMMFEKFRPKELDSFDKFYDGVRKKKLTTAILQKFFFDHKEEENIIDKICELEKLVEYYKPKDNVDGMYQ